MAGGYYNGVYVPNLNPYAGQNPMTGAPIGQTSAIKGAAGTPGGPPLRAPSDMGLAANQQNKNAIAAGDTTGIYGYSPGQQNAPARPQGPQQMPSFPNQSYYESQQNLANQQRASMFGTLSSALSGLSSGYSSQLPQQPSVAAPAPQYASLDVSNAAQNAAFGQLKAKSGVLGRSALQGLRGELSERGILGSGEESRGLTDILAGATNPLSDLNTAALKENVNIGLHNADIANQINQAGYQGSITQRGQNIQQQENEANRSAQIQQTLLNTILGSLRTLY